MLQIIAKWLPFKNINQTWNEWKSDYRPKTVNNSKRNFERYSGFFKIGSHMVCLYRSRLVLLFDRPGLASWLITHACDVSAFHLLWPALWLIAMAYTSARSFSVVGNKLKLKIMLGSEVDLYTAIWVHEPIYMWPNFGKPGLLCKNQNSSYW